MSDFPSHPYPWQLQEWQQLSQQIAAKKLPHALMFAGAKGIGKRHLAEALAQLLLCLSPIEGTPCGKCRGCMLNKAQNHPDLIVISPEEGAKGIKVDQVRALIEDLGKTAQQGGYKVVVLEPAEAMNANAANALLKSLEEPAASTLLILVCHFYLAEFLNLAILIFHQNHNQMLLQLLLLLQICLQKNVFF